MSYKIIKFVKTLAHSLQSSPLLAIFTSSIEKPSGIIFSFSHISKKPKWLELISIWPKRMQIFTTLGKELETKQKTKQAKVKSQK